MDRDRNREETRVLIYNNPRDAEVAKGQLEERGIEAFISSDNTHPPMQMAEGVQLFVLENDAEEAFDVLKAFDMLPDDQAGPAKTGAGSGFSASRQSSWQRVVFYFIAALLILGFLIFGLA